MAFLPVSTSSAVTSRSCVSGSSPIFPTLPLTNFKWSLAVTFAQKSCKHAGCSDVNVENRDFRFGIERVDVGAVFQRGRATHARAIRQMVFVPGAGALNEGDAARLLAV